MGQRTQVIVKMPSLYDVDNPNHKETHLIAYHNQWLYGINFLKWSARFVLAIEHFRENSEFTFKQEDLDNAINHANYADLNYITNTHRYRNDKRDYLEDNKLFYDSLNEIDFLNKFDNNNGFLYVDLTVKPLRLVIYSGVEDTRTVIRKCKQPDEYLRRFYSPDELNKNKDLELLGGIKTLEKFYNERLEIHV